MMESIVQNLFSTQDGILWLAVRWAVIVLVAGFIGQFGKAFATYLMRRTRERKEPEAQGSSGTTPEAAEPQRPVLQQKSFPAQPATEPPVRMKDDKKQKKALAKQQKKLLKKLFK
jgi:hypothetical protein